MILRARDLFFGWLVYGALQLALLGVPGAAAEPGVANRGARSHSESHSVSFGKRVIASDPAERRALTTPFAPSAHIRLDLPTVAGRDAAVASDQLAETHAHRVFPPARAPPALA
jgi:hypothetical protein